MAFFQAYARVDINRLDFSFVFEHTIGRQFFNDTNRPLFNTVYRDLYSITGQVQPRIETLYVAGPNIIVSPSSNLQSGTLTYVEMANSTGYTGFYATGVTISVASLLSVTTTPTTADDAALVAAELGGNDTLYLSPYSDIFHGYGGNDRIYGDVGNDRLFGDAGNDLIVGGSGADRLAGGPGADRFHYDYPFDGGDNIVNFDAADTFSFFHPFVGLPVGGLNETRFHSGTTNLASSPQQRFVFRTTDDTLWYDFNGSEGGGLTKIADLSNNFNLSYGDILIV
jgi:hypothetical protein